MLKNSEARGLRTCVILSLSKKGTPNHPSNKFDEGLIFWFWRRVRSVYYNKIGAQMWRVRRVGETNNERWNIWCTRWVDGRKWTNRTRCEFAELNGVILRTIGLVRTRSAQATKWNFAYLLSPCSGVNKVSTDIIKWLRRTVSLRNQIIPYILNSWTKNLHLLSLE